MGLVVPTIPMVDQAIPTGVFRVPMDMDMDSTRGRRMLKLHIIMDQLELTILMVDLAIPTGAFRVPMDMARGKRRLSPAMATALLV